MSLSEEDLDNLLALISGPNISIRGDWVQTVAMLQLKLKAMLEIKGGDPASTPANPQGSPQ